MHNTEKVPSFVTANLLTSHFTTYRFAVQITAKVSIFACKFCVAVEIRHVGNGLRHAEFLHMLELERLSQVNLTTQTSKCGFESLEQCIPEIGLLSFLLTMASTNLFSSSLLSASLFLRS